MPRIRVQCPKCYSEGAWYQHDNRDIWLRCLCGYCKVVETTQDSIVITHPDVGADISLPRRDSKLYRCLAMLIGLREATTAQIASQLGVSEAQQSNSDIASQLTVLRYKGFVEVVTGRKGAPGGSTWKPTEIAMRLLAKECG